MRSVLIYSALRLAAFVVPFAIFMLFPAFQAQPWLAAVFAALIGLSLSIIFLQNRRDAVSVDLAERRERSAASAAAVDADLEDAANEAAQAPPAAGEGSSTQPTNARNNSSA